MRHEPSWLVKGGHCNAIQKRGPFVIGKDFVAPAPAGRSLPKIKLTSVVLENLKKCLARARSSVADDVADTISDDELFSEVTAELALENEVSHALTWYVSDYQFQPDEKKIRSQIKLLKKRIDRFKSQLPEEYDALGKFIYDSYTGEIFLRDDLKPSETHLIALQDAWREKFGFIAIRETFDVMLRYVSAAEQCLGKRKPLNHRVLALVQNLATAWLEASGTWPKSGRDPATSKQTGPFADFVRIANDILPKSFRINSLDAAIREVCEQGA
jgi:hypothetical protein